MFEPSEKTLRDLFAAAFLAGLVSNPEAWRVSKADAIAREAYAHADAMIVQRKETKRT